MPTDKYAWKMRNNSMSKPANIGRSPPRATHTRTFNDHDVTPTRTTGNNTNRTKHSIAETIKKKQKDGKKSK